MITEYLVDPKLIEIEPEYVSANPNLIYEYLRYCHKDMASLPVVTCRDVAGRLLVVRGLEYLMVAKEAKFPLIKMVLEGEASQAVMARLRVFNVIKKVPAPPEYVQRPLFFFFSSRLSERGKQRFDEMTRAHFGTSRGDLVFLDDDRVASFIGTIRMLDYAWARALRDSVANFGDAGVYIISQDGLRLRG